MSVDGFENILNGQFLVVFVIWYDCVVIEDVVGNVGVDQGYCSGWDGFVVICQDDDVVQVVFVYGQFDVVGDYFVGDQ